MLTTNEATSASRAPRQPQLIPHRSDVDAASRATPTPAQPPAGTVLGLVLHPRETGYAVLGPGATLLTSGIMNLRKLVSNQGKEVRFRHEVAQLIEQHGVRTVAVVAPPPHLAEHELTPALQLWLRDESTRQRLALTTQRQRDVIRDVVGDAALPHTLRGLAWRLARDHPELAGKAPPVNGLGTGERYQRTSKERYWQPMFLALGAATVVSTEEERGQPGASNAEWS